MTTEQAIERVAQRVVDNTNNIKLKDRQRRYTVTDLYGVEYTRSGDYDKPAEFYISISPDMVYLMRFEFKLIIFGSVANDFSVTIEGVNVTPYLMAQYSSWVSGEGVYPSLEIGENYDILEVAGDLVAEGREADAEKLLKPGYKKVVLRSVYPFTATLVNYLKYNAIDR